MASSIDNANVRIAIIGGGIGGLSMAIALKRQLGYENFVIYEKADEIGGTWWHNTYPGAGSDVLAHWYSLSTDLNPSWSSYLPPQSELLSYWLKLTHKYALRPHLALHTSLDRAEWDDAKQVYRLTLRDVKTGEVRMEEAEVVVSATGGLSVPVVRGLDGIERFEGESWHSAKWRHDVDLKGKRVGVIGNGCSAAQLIPEISEDESVQIMNFCRTPQWYFPRNNAPYPAWARWAFAYVPLLMRLYRFGVFLSYEMLYACFHEKHKNTMGRLLRWMVTRYMEKTIPEKYKETLWPKFPPGCKRLIFDSGYLDSLRRPNVHITFEGIECIVPEGVKLKNGKIVKLDVLVYSTGFDTTRCAINIVGEGGKSLQGYFDEKGRPVAYLGTTVPGFPNFFIIYGPNTITGHASVIYTLESQINYTMKLLKPLITHHARSLSVKSTACDAYNADLQRRLDGTVFTQCVSWYRSGKDGKNPHVYPGPVSLFWLWTLWVKWEDYNVRDSGDGEWERWESKRKTREMGLWGAMGAAIAALGYLLKGIV